MDETTHDDETKNTLPPVGHREPEAPAQWLTRQEISDVDDIRQEPVNVPEWGGMVMVRGLTGTERDEFEGSIIVEKRDPNRKGKTKTGIEHKQMRAKLVVMAVVHPPGTPQAGEKMFDVTDIGWISKKSAAALDRVFSKAQELSGLSDDDIDELMEDRKPGGADTTGGSMPV